MARIELDTGDLRITIEGESKDFWKRDIHTRAVIALIAEADISAWDKDDPGALDDFAAQVLTALATTWKLNAPDSESEALSVGGVTEEMVMALTEEGLLNEIIRFDNDEDRDL